MQIEQQQLKTRQRAEEARQNAAALRKKIAADRIEKILRHCGASNQEIRETGGFRRVQ